MFEIGLFIVLMIAGYTCGTIAEKRHYRAILKREAALNTLPAIASRYPPKDQAYDQQLVIGAVVVASDYFKSFLAGLVNFFGGAVVSYESLIDRARREAMLRMKANAQSLNADYVFNIKFETMSVGTGRLASVEVLAYGTALTPTKSGNAPTLTDQERIT